MTELKPQVIYNDDDYLVIDKPAGLLVHAGVDKSELSLVDWLLQNYPQIRTVGEDSSRPGIVHRLDRDVSGLMVVAKNNKSFAHLKEQFKSRQVEKIYLALAHGQISKDEATINFPIKRAKGGHKMAALPLNTEDLLSRPSPRQRDQGNISGLFKAREAITEFSVIKRYVNYTYIQVKLITGRTHQIRVHLSAYGHPLLGDDLYATKKSKQRNVKINLGRIFLFASKLSFLSLEGKKLEFSLELPAELQKALPKN